MATKRSGRKTSKKTAEGASDARYAMMAELFPRTGVSRSDKRRLEIIDGAMASYAKHGLHGTNFRTVAEEAKTGYTLVRHYFEDMDALFEAVATVVRFGMQQFVVERLKKAASPEAQLEAYVDATLEWRTAFPKHVHVWVLFWFRCSVDEKFRSLNTRFQSLGRERIAAMVKDGIELGQFTAGNTEERAALIQAVINGGLVLLGTENLPHAARFRSQLIAHCLRIAKG